MRNYTTKTLICVNENCDKIGDIVVNQQRCASCGGDLFPAEDFDITSFVGGDDDLPPEEMNDIHRQPMQHTIPFTGHNQPPKRQVPNDTFTCPSDLRGCPVAQKAIVRVAYERYLNWVYMAKEISTEWFAYLIGRQEETPQGLVYHVEDEYYPKQIASQGHVGVDDRLGVQIREGTIGTIHSHNTMNVFFSAEDLAHINHPVELIINAKGDIIGDGRTRLECGRYHRGTATIVLTGSPSMNESVAQMRKAIVRGPETLYTTTSSKKDSKSFLNLAASAYGFVGD